MIWYGDEPEPERRPFAPRDWLNVAVRGSVLAAVVYGLLLVFWLLRLFEAPFGSRALSPFVTQAVCRTAFVVLGIRFSTHGRPMRHRGAVVANHSSWMDIFSLNAPQRNFFVSKAEVSGWPGIGVLARSTGTVFIERRRGDARAQAEVFADRLKAGHRLLFFPEGTSTDARRIIPFKSTLFAAFFADGLRETMAIQPVSVIYHAPPGEDARFFGWWGDMDFAPHLLKVLARGRGGAVEVVFHEPLRVADFPDRKALARAAESAVRQGLEAYLPDRMRA